jgi:hypothetical protein
MPGMYNLSVGGLWLDTPAADYLNTVIPSFYEHEDVSGDIVNAANGKPEDSK